MLVAAVNACHPTTDNKFGVKYSCLWPNTAVISIFCPGDLTCARRCFGVLFPTATQCTRNPSGEALGSPYAKANCALINPLLANVGNIGVLQPAASGGRMMLRR